MHLLIINPNASAAVTERIRVSAGRVTEPGDAFQVVGAAQGPMLIVTPEDNARAERAVLACVEAHAGEAEAIVLASFGNTGLAQVRARSSRPVLGIAHAAYYTAAALADRFMLLTLHPDLVPGLRQGVAEAGHAGRLVGCLSLQAASESLPVTAQDWASHLEGRLDAWQALCRQAVACPGVGCLVIGGGPLAGLADALRPTCPLPIIDGTQAAIALLRGACGRWGRRESGSGAGAPGSVGRHSPAVHAGCDDAGCA
jgi:allantoin racemase